MAQALPARPTAAFLTGPASLSVNVTGQFAFGGGRYTVRGVVQTSFGFVVTQGPKGTYTGRLSVVTPGKWRFQANVTSFGLAGEAQAACTCGTRL